MSGIISTTPLPPIRDEPTKYYGLKTEFVLRAAVRLVKILSCLAYDWAVKG